MAIGAVYKREQSRQGDIMHIEKAQVGLFDLYLDGAKFVGDIKAYVSRPEVSSILLDIATGIANAIILLLIVKIAIVGI